MPAGGSLQARAGDASSPSQVNRVGISPWGSKAGEVRVKVMVATARPGTRAKATLSPLRPMTIGAATVGLALPGPAAAC